MWTEALAIKMSFFSGQTNNMKYHFLNRSRYRYLSDAFSREVIVVIEGTALMNAE